MLLVSGGDALYLCHWMRECGLTDLLPPLDDTVWIGMSAGSMVMTPRIGKEFVGWKPPAGDDRALGLVDFSIFPHLDHELLPDNTLANAKSMGCRSRLSRVRDRRRDRHPRGRRRRRCRVGRSVASVRRVARPDQHWLLV